MRILFDHGTPAPLIPFLVKHNVTKARDAGWGRLTNGELLNAAETAGFAVLVATDKNMRYQQNLSGRVISIVVLGNSQWRIAVNFVEVITRESMTLNPEAMPKLTSHCRPRSRLRVPELKTTVALGLPVLDGFIVRLRRGRSYRGLNLLS